MGRLNFESDQFVVKAEVLASAKAASCKPVSTHPDVALTVGIIRSFLTRKEAT